MDDERQLVLALRRGETDAFDELYRRHHERIWRFLTRLAGIAAEDLFQDTWLAAARHARFLREDTALLPWLFTVARNKHRNARRFGVFDHRRKEALAASTPFLPGQAEEAALARVQAERVNLAFARLPEAFREVLLLCSVEGLESPEAARVLGISAEAVRKRLSRARAELARRLGMDDEPGGKP